MKKMKNSVQKRMYTQKRTTSVVKEEKKEPMSPTKSNTTPIDFGEDEAEEEVKEESKEDQMEIGYELIYPSEYNTECEY